MSNNSIGKKILIGMSASELTELVRSIGAPDFRAKQLSDWIYAKSVASYDEMLNISKDLRVKLEQIAAVSSTELFEKKCSRDGTIKTLIKLNDKEIIESVLLPSNDRVSGCISTLVGCPMGCSFCATALGGFTRNLSSGEIVEQVLLLNRLTDRKLTHVVYMGMGEPLLNLDNVVRSAHIIHDEIGISMRRLTISTVGIVPKIIELANLRLPITLAISLHAPDDKTRDKLIPANKNWKVNEVINSAKEYIQLTGRKITFEYLLLNGVNDSIEQADMLAKLIRGIQCVVNIIPFNDVEGLPFSKPPERKIKAFRNALEQLGVNVTQRMERGQDIEAACGQLRGIHIGRYHHPNQRVMKAAQL